MRPALCIFAMSSAFVFPVQSHAMVGKGKVRTGQSEVMGITSYNSSRAGMGVCVCFEAEEVSDADEDGEIP